MPGIINTSNYGSALFPGLNTWYGNAYDEWEVQYTDLFNTYTAPKRAFIEDVGTVNFGLAKKIPEGSPVEFDATEQGFKTRYTFTVFGLGFIITQIMIDDDQYAIAGEKGAKGLAFSLRQTKEINGANVYNRAFSSAYTGGDGVSMVNTAHPNKSGGTWSNQQNADLSEAALEQAMIDIMSWTDDRGNRIAVMPQTLHISPTEMFNASRILDSNLRVGTANNDINALKYLGKLPGGVKVNNYFTDPDAWFIRTNAPDGTKYFERAPDTFSQDNDFVTSNLLYKASGRYAFGWTDPRGVYGSPGV